jgi:hypothetical protein
LDSSKAWSSWLGLALGAVGTAVLVSSYVPMPFPVGGLVEPAILVGLVGFVLCVVSVKSAGWSWIASTGLVLGLAPLLINLVDLGHALLTM